MLAREDRRKPQPAGDTYDETMSQSVVLTYVLTECPEGISVTSLAARLDGQLRQPEGGMAVEVAVRELVCCCLLQMRGGLVVPGQDDDEPEFGE